MLTQSIRGGHHIAYLRSVVSNVGGTHREYVVFKVSVRIIADNRHKGHTMKMYSLRGISEKYGIGLPMLKKMVANKDLEVIKIGAKNFVREKEIENYIERRTVKRREDV